MGKPVLAAASEQLFTKDRREIWIRLVCTAEGWGDRGTGLIA
jgi:hypothetical protein